MDKRVYIEELRLLGEEVQKLEEKNCPTDASKWSYYKSQAKKKFDVYPSAYANGWASKQYKAAGGGWKQCAGESVEESVNEGKHDVILDKLAGMVKNSKSFMDIGKELKKNGIKYSFGTSPLPMYIIDKPVKIAILNNKYADGAERVVGTTAIGLMESVTEGKKVFKVNPAIGKAKYSISSHDGVKKHKDGSDFFDIETFKNKVDLEKAIKKYTANGFKMESVNEAASRTAMEIGGLTGMNKDAIQKFVDDNKLDIEKVYQYVKVGKLPERMALVSAIAGKPGNSVQVKLIKKFK